MTELSVQERAQLEEAFTKVLASSDSTGLETPKLAAAGGVDPRQLFCQNWPLVKTVLQFLGGVLPVWLRPIIATIIKLGDAAHGTLCG